MRTFGSDSVADEVVRETWATDRVHVFASWPNLCLVVCSDLGETGSQDVNNVVSNRKIGWSGVHCAVLERARGAFWIVARPELPVAFSLPRVHTEKTSP